VTAAPLRGEVMWASCRFTTALRLRGDGREPGCCGTARPADAPAAALERGSL